jgi:spore germination cell wall hydrolase CwlJ-like protein
VTTLICLAAAIYFEARSEPLDAQAAVAGVVLERVAHDKYPDNVCGVVLQHKQFSAFNSGVPTVRNTTAWDTSLLVAKAVLDDPDGVVPILGATHYHTVDVNPYWASQFEYLGRSGSHLFYRGF